MSTQQHDQQIPANCYYVDPNTAPLTVAAMNDCRDFVQTMLHKTQCYMHGTIIDTLRKENEALHGKIRLLAQTDVNAAVAQLKTLVDKLGTSPLSEVPPNMINQQQYIIRECGNIQSEQLRTKTQIEKFSHLIIVFLEGLQKVVDYAPPTETNTTVLTMKQMLNELVAKVSNELVASSNIVI